MSDKMGLTDAHPNIHHLPAHQTSQHLGKPSMPDLSNGSTNKVIVSLFSFFQKLMRKHFVPRMAI